MHCIKSEVKGKVKNNVNGLISPTEAMSWAYQADSHLELVDG